MRFKFWKKKVEPVVASGWEWRSLPHLSNEALFGIAISHPDAEFASAAVAEVDRRSGR